MRPALSAFLFIAGALVLIASWPRGAPLPPIASAPAPGATLGLLPPTYSPSITASATSPPIPDGYRVAMPRLAIDLPIAEGDLLRDVEQQRTPEGFAFHLPGSAIPGERGNTYLYAHARAGMFLALWDARVGDEVVVTAPDGVAIRYVVTEVRPRVPPGDTSVALPTEDERLTLQTSTGPDPGDPRFVVIARRS